MIATYFLRLLCALMLVASATSLHAQPVLHCRITHIGSVQTVTQTPVSDPYRVRSVDIDGRFRFKAVVMGDEHRVDYIALYTYYLRDDLSVLLHEAKYVQPAMTPEAGSLTGLISVYGPPLGRELQYSCVLKDDAS